MNSDYKQQQNKVELAQSDFQDFIYDLIDKAFDAGREAESRRNKTGSIKGYKNELWNLQIKYGSVALFTVNNLVNECNKLNDMKEQS